MLNTGQTQTVFPLSCTYENLAKRELVKMEEIETEYYLRFSVLDQVGVLADIAKHLGQNNISIRSMIQKSAGEDKDQPVSIVIITHMAVEKDIRDALKRIDALPFIKRPTKILRIDL